LLDKKKYGNTLGFFPSIIATNKYF